METNSSSASPFEEFVSNQLTDDALFFLENAAKWARFMAILGFIGIAFMVIAGFIMMAAGSAIDASGELPFSGSMLAMVYFVMAVVYGIPIYYLFQFANNVRNSLSQQDSSLLTEAFRFLRAHYRFFGIATIVMISLYFIGILVGGAFMASMM